MTEQFCAECGGALFYDAPLKRYVCKSCGIFVTREELFDLKEKLRREGEDRRKKRQERDEYLEWWLSKK